jgi:integrase
MDVERQAKFTEEYLASLPPAERGKRYSVRDTETRSLFIRVTDRGLKSFIFRKKINGKSRRIWIAYFPDMSLKRARGEAGGYAKEVSEGKDPSDKKVIERQEMTLQKLFDKYLEDHAKPRKRTWKEDKSKFEQYLASNEDGINLAERKLSEIRKSDFEALHSKIGKTHKVTANHVIALASSIFGRSIRWELFEGQNPCRGIQKFPETSRERFLQGDELAKFFRALKDEPLRDYFLMLLLTGARSENVQSMAWKEIKIIDDGRAEWAIPRTKSGKPQIVPLTSEAIEILKARKKTNEKKKAEEKSEFVFPSKGKYKHTGQPKRAWVRILKAAGLSDLRMHDLRRSLASAMLANNVNVAVVQKTLGHADIATTMVYARLNIDPVRAAMQSTTSALWTAGGLKPKAKRKR